MNDLMGALAVSLLEIAIGLFGAGLVSLVTIVWASSSGDPELATFGALGVGPAAAICWRLYGFKPDSVYVMGLAVVFGVAHWALVGELFGDDALSVGVRDRIPIGMLFVGMMVAWWITSRGEEDR